MTRTIIFLPIMLAITTRVNKNDSIKIDRFGLVIGTTGKPTDRDVPDKDTHGNKRKQTPCFP